MTIRWVPAEALETRDPADLLAGEADAAADDDVDTLPAGELLHRGHRITAIAFGVGALVASLIPSSANLVAT